MFFSRFIPLLLLSPLLVSAEDVALEEILEASREIRKEASEQPEEVPVPLEVPDTVLSTDTAWLKGRELPPDPSGNSESKTQQQRAWNTIMSGTEEGSAVANLGDGPPRPPVPEDIMYVYFSLSMPDETIKALFHQALAHDELRSIVFVLRGWKPPGLNDLVARLNKLFPGAKKLQDLPNVQIDPNLYEQQGVDRVPTFSTKDRNGRWGTVVGSTSIVDAVSRIESGRYDGEVIGPTFDIEEPNILDIIRERIAEHDWNNDVERVKETILTKTTTGSALPAASTNESYLVDLTIVNNQTLRGSSGEVFAPAGASVNPFDYIDTQRRYIFFDANDEAQLAQAMRWRQEHDYTTLITTIPIRSVEARKAALERLRQPIYEINQMIIQRFKLKAVPSIAFQEGRMLRVSIVAVNPTTANLQGDR